MNNDADHARRWKALAKRFRELLDTTNGIALENMRTIERLRPGHTHECNSRFSHGDGSWCICAVQDEAGSLAAVVRVSEERDIATDTLRWLVGTLPKCDRCDQPATAAHGRGAGRFCDAHKGDAPDYPRAHALRVALGLLAGKNGP